MAWREQQARGAKAQQRVLLQVCCLHRGNRREKDRLPLLQAGGWTGSERLWAAANEGDDAGAGLRQRQLLRSLLQAGCRWLLHILLLLLLLRCVLLRGGHHCRGRRHRRRRLLRQLRHRRGRAAFPPHVLPDVLHLLARHGLHKILLGAVLHRRRHRFLLVQRRHHCRQGRGRTGADGVSTWRLGAAAGGRQVGCRQQGRGKRRADVEICRSSGVPAGSPTGRRQPLTDGHGAEVGIRLDAVQQLQAVQLRHAHVLQAGGAAGWV